MVFRAVSLMLVERLDMLESLRETISRARNHVSNPSPRRVHGILSGDRNVKMSRYPRKRYFHEPCVTVSFPLPLTSQMCQTRCR